MSIFNVVKRNLLNSVKKEVCSCVTNKNGLYNFEFLRLHNSIFHYKAILYVRSYITNLHILDVKTKNSYKCKICERMLNVASESISTALCGHSSSLTKTYSESMGQILGVFCSCCRQVASKDDDDIREVTEKLIADVEEEDSVRQCLLSADNTVSAGLPNEVSRPIECEAQVAVHDFVDPCINNNHQNSVNKIGDRERPIDETAESNGRESVAHKADSPAVESRGTKRVAVVSVDVPEKYSRLEDAENIVQESSPVMVAGTLDSDLKQSKSRKKRGKKKQQLTSGGTKHERKIPNYFAAFKVSSPEISANFEKIQQHIIAQDQRLGSCMIPLSTLHITLMVMHLADEEEHSRALSALKAIHEEFKETMHSAPLQLEFKGLGNFQNKVVFAKISDGDALKRLFAFSASVVKNFEAVNIPATADKFDPHLTLMKLSRDKNIFRLGVKKINPSLYVQYVDQLFGVQVVEGVQLLKMAGPKDENGYYTGDELLFDVPLKK